MSAGRIMVEHAVVVVLSTLGGVAVARGR